MLIKIHDFMYFEVQRYYFHSQVYIGIVRNSKGLSSGERPEERKRESETHRRTSNGTKVNGKRVVGHKERPERGDNKVTG